ncbi:MAG: hypothetical protein WA005_03865, partial [Candidatus Binataceae bacterium]
MSNSVRAPVRRARSRPALLTALALTLCGCAYAIVSGGELNQSKAEQVKEGIQSLRQLKFKSDVPFVLEGPEGAEAILEGELRRDNSDEQLRIDGLVGSLLGLYPTGIDLKAETLKLLKEQVAAFYEPHTNEMVVVAGAMNLGLWNGMAQFLIQRDVVGEMMLAHELTHALQDQHFGLEQNLEKFKDNSDRALALKCVAEGDATLAGFGYVIGRLDDETADELVSKMDELPKEFAAKTVGVPQGLSAPLIFQYSAGTRLVAQAYRRGGWRAVDALYREMPQSSQQVMHPGLYFEGLAPVVEIKLAGYEHELAGWDQGSEDSYGELLLQIILERVLGADSPDLPLADRWAGDRLVALRKGQSVTVLWLVMFRDDHSAQRFAAVYASALDRTLGATVPHRVGYRLQAVLVSIGESAQKFVSLEPAVWAATK